MFYDKARFHSCHTLKKKKKSLCVIRNGGGKHAQRETERLHLRNMADLTELKACLKLYCNVTFPIKEEKRGEKEIERVLSFVIRAMT